MSQRYMIAAALAAAVAVPTIVAAQTPASAPAFQAEKCYGVAKAGKNDCASTGNNSCGGTARRDADGKAWMFVPAGTCERIVGGSKTPKA